MEPESLPHFQVGDRVKLSELGKSRRPRAASEFGTVFAAPRGKASVWVRFDGNKSPTPLHTSYIERVGAAIELSLKAKPNEKR
jgi:hypothetical protein